MQRLTSISLFFPFVVIACGSGDGSSTSTPTDPAVCAAQDCDSFALYIGDAPKGVLLGRPNVTACRDDVCATAAYHDGLVIPLADHTKVRVDVGAQIDVEWDTPPYLNADGDVYYLRLDDAATGATLFTIDSGPVEYRLNQIADCPPKCLQVNIPESAGHG